MWIFTNRGYISVVSKKDSPNEVMVRSREKSVLSWIQEVAKAEELTVSRIYEYDHLKCDYKYRLFMTKYDFSCLMAWLILNMEYTNFKDSIKNQEYGNLCMNIWIEVKIWYSKWSYLKK
jgi:hypothetical protein